MRMASPLAFPSGDGRPVVSLAGLSSQHRGIEPLRSTGGLVHSLKSIAAQHGDEEEVVAVCEKWTHRLLELERQAIDDGIAR
jgi:hypothetical protein